MNNLESFSLSTNLPIGQPYIQRDYFPLEIDVSNAVLILNTFEDPRKQSRIYDYFQDVIDFGSQELAKRGYFFFQPLTGKETVLRCQNSVFNLTPNQIAYLVDNCALVLGNDNIYSHISNESGKKCITLFGPSSPVSHAPKFNPQLFTAIRESKSSPSYRSLESPKSINEIKTETVLNKIYEKLELNSSSNLDSIYFGAEYPTSVIEIIPDSIVNPENFADKPTTIRMDYLHNEEILFATLQNRKCNIICKGKVNLDKLKFFKKNIVAFNYQINKNVDISYVKDLIKTGVRIIFTSEETGEDLSETRMKMFDYQLVEQYIPQGVDADILAKTDKTTHYRTNHFILSEGKIYPTYQSYLKKENIPSFSQNIVRFNAYDKSFWEILPFVRLFNLTSS
jgi:hypothetical protein